MKRGGFRVFLGLQGSKWKGSGVGFWDVLVFRSQSANRIDELYYKGMRRRRDAAARAGTKRGARGAQSERRQTG
jgi:hypothetical protein